MDPKCLLPLDSHLPCRPMQFHGSQVLEVGLSKCGWGHRSLPAQVVFFLPFFFLLNFHHAYL